ncbi:MAG: LamG-like jellyroll fold domain-containing protein, partial [Cyanobacteria bacterium P01_D01_bin.105]
TDNADFSVSFWLKVEADSTGSWRKILHRGETERDRNFGLWMHPNSNHLTYRVSTTASWNEGGSSQRELTLNQWTHVSYVKEDNKLSLYLDGQFESSITLRGEVIGSSGPLRLGSTGLDASLDELRLYDRALTQQDVSVLSLSSILTTDTSSESDLIQGGAGDDVAFGGDGNDVIYGDTQTERFGESMSGAHVYKGHTYFLTQTASTWNEAQTEAQRLGGNLVTINSADEEAWLQRTFVNEKTWIGLTDRRAEGAFEWASSEAVTYTNWAPGEPNNSGDQDYATMNFGANRQWDDTTSAAFHRGVIEINSTDNDTLFGDAGNDTVYGQTGNDALYGDTLAAALSEGLITYLDFNEGTGSTSSSHTSTGTFVGGTSWTAGKLGNAVQLDGNSGRVLVQDSAELNITHQLTLSAWVKADQFTKWTGIITKGTNSAPYSLMIMDDGAIQFESNYGQADKGMWKSHGQLTANEWHHVAATYDGEALRFYIDGQLDSNVVYTDIDFAINNEDLIVGAQLPGGDEYFDGALDDVRVYNRALSNVEVNALATSDENSGSILNLAEDAIYHNGSYYLLSSNDLTWEEAQAQAESIGGNLVTINDAAEEAWLHTTFSASGELWIGLTDKSVEGQFEWASGEAVTYTNWSPNEPNDSGAGEDYAIFNRAGTQQWDDRGQPNQVYQGIIEIQGIGADNLEGGVGNDLLVGGLGNDVLNGTDAVAAGKVERDTMLGGKGADIFVLGNVEQAYYQGRGDQDYALIKDFSSAEGDKLQIHGSTSSYTQQQQGRDLYLYRQGTTSDLVAIFENTTTLDLSTVTLNS